MLDGGLGNDVFYVDNDQDVLLDAGGVDKIIAVNRSWTLGAGFENLHLNDWEESAETGIGNELNNVMSFGWSGRLEGRGGNDTLIGGIREGFLFGEGGNDSLLGSGHFVLDGGIGNDTLVGAASRTSSSFP